MKKTTVVITIASIALSAIVILLLLHDNSLVDKLQKLINAGSYYSEEVTFQNKEANITLAGTLTLPKNEGTYPAVILISGSGPQDRNAEVYGHKPFLTISDYLTKKGIAVLRYDDRGFGQSSGNFQKATSVDFSKDVESAVAYLKSRKEINKDEIGLIGHSEGGLIAPMVAARSNDIDFIVLLAAPGIRGDKILVEQQALLQKASGASISEIQKLKKLNEETFKIVTPSKNPQAIKIEVSKLMNDMVDSVIRYIVPPEMTKEQIISDRIDFLSSPWSIFFINYDPKPTLKKVPCPVLALNGEKDLQVPAAENLSAIKRALKEGGNNNVTVKKLPNLNHLFQEGETGLPQEYAQDKPAFPPNVLEEISDWILKQVN